MFRAPPDVNIFMDIVPRWGFFEIAFVELSFVPRVHNKDNEHRYQHQCHSTYVHLSSINIYSKG